MIISLRHTFGLGLLLLAGTVQAQSAFDLYATAGSTTLPDGQTASVLGFATVGATPVTQPGGPVLFVNQGELVTVTLHNDLSEPTALLFQGQAMVPDTVGVATGGTKVYSFTAGNPGTFLYEAGPIANAQHQVARGLHGALVVRPVFATPPLQPQAYASATTAYDDEAVLVLSELDPALNGSPTPATFDMRNYAPRYFLINGKAYPATAPIATTAGRKVLLRYVNAGIRHHSMSLLGVQQDLVAKDGSPSTYTGRRVAETIAPGQTMDAIATIPAGATGQQFALMDGNLNLFNNQAPGLGGMLTFVTTAGTPALAGPVVTALSLSPDLATLAASITASAGRTVAAAEYWVDTGAHAAMTSTAGTWSASIPVQPTGTHTAYVRGQDDALTWGAPRSITFSVDTTGPATTGLGVAPNPTNGTASVAVTATGDDRATGGANVTAAEYAIDAGPATAMAVNTAATVVSLTATIPAGTVNALSAGAHVVSVRSQDALGNWGAQATAALVVDKTGPTASNVVASPNPTNGAIGFNSNTPAVRLTATLADTASGIAAGEGFIDTVGANGTGFPIIPADGQFSSLSEAGYADIPLTTINQLSAGSHTIHVHGKDAAGNWGATATVNLVLDKTAPTISSVTLTPGTVAVGTASALAVAAADTGTGVTGGQYWIDGTATPPANPSSFTGTSASIATSTLSGAVHTVYVRVRDAAGNWSAVSSRTLTVIRAVNDARSITANTSATQNSDANAAAGVLTNDEPIGLAGRTASLATAPVRTSGAGTGTITLSCPTALGTAATPAIGGNTVCTNGAYRVTLNGIGTSGNARQASKRGTFQFSYRENLNGASSLATVTITVN
jgi:hypothetical protein